MNTNETIKPTRVIRPFSDSPIEIHLFGQNRGSTDWGITNLMRPSEKVYALIDGVSPVRRLYAPQPSFNARVCAYTELVVCIQDKLGFSGRNTGFSSTRGGKIFRGVNADGCNVPVGTGFWLSSADCFTIVAYGYRNSGLICAHAGRDSLVDG